jgi:hypothetical protein
MPDEERPLLTFVVAEPAGYCDPETGLCATPHAEPGPASPAYDSERAGEDQLTGSSPGVTVTLLEA